MSSDESSETVRVGCVLLAQALAVEAARRDPTLPARIQAVVDDTQAIRAVDPQAWDKLALDAGGHEAAMLTVMTQLVQMGTT
jgi:hypothetical protein